MSAKNTYEAFISYRQHPIDTRIAREIQSRIEHYRIPKEIQGRTGKKKFRKIFLDQSDLSGAADLPAAIAKALERSDWLFVICSERTHLSRWVLREIEMFLKTHDRDHILTILADGEPENVIPEILRKEEIPVVKADGNTDTLVRQLEPLSIDFRSKRSAVRKIETTRLAACLLDCPFDDLYRREMRYRHRQSLLLAGGLLSLTAAAAVFLLWSNRQISKNYAESVRQRVLNAKTLEYEYLEKGMRISALRTGLSTLDLLSEDALQGYPDLLNGLEKAARLYDLPMKGLPENLVNTQEISLEGTPVSFSADPAGKYLLISDSLQNLVLWSLERRERVFSETEENVYDNLAVTENGYAFAIEENVLTCFDVSTGRRLWKQTFLEDILSLSGKEARRIQVWTLEASLSLDAETGNILSRETYVSFLPDTADPNTVIRAFETAFVPGHDRWLLGKRYIEDPYAFPAARPSATTVLLDLQKRAVYDLDEGRMKIPDELLPSEDGILLDSSGEIFRAVPSANAPGGFIVCRVHKDQGIRWKKYVAALPMPVDIRKNTDYHKEAVRICADEEARKLYVFDTQTFAILHMDTGELLSSQSLSARFMLPDANGQPFFIFEDGIGCLDQDDRLLLRRLPFGAFDRCLFIPLKQNERKTRLLAFSREKTVYVFEPSASCAELFDFPGSYSNPDGIRWMLSGDSLLEYQVVGKKSFLRRYRAGSADSIWTRETENAFFDIVGLDSTGKYLLVKHETFQPYRPPESTVFRVSTETGEVCRSFPPEITAADEDDFNSMEPYATVLGGQDGNIVYHVLYFNGYDAAQKQSILVSNPETGERWEFPVPFEIASNSSESAEVLSDSEIMCLSDQGDLFIVDTKTGNVSFLGELLQDERLETIMVIGALRAFRLTNGSYGAFLQGTNELKLFDKEELTLLSIHCSAGILSANERNGTLALLCGDGALRLYDAEDARLIGTVELACDTNYYGSHPEGFPLYFLSDDEIVVTCHRGCYIVNIPRLMIRSEIPTGLGYAPALDGFFVGIPTDKPAEQQLGFIKRFTTEELIARAREELNGF